MTGQFSIEWVISENRYDSILGDIFGCIHRCLIMIRMHTIHNQCLCISNIGSDLMKRKKLKTIIVFLKHPQFVLGFAFNLKIETFPECLTTCNIIRPHAASSQIPQGIRLLLIDMKYEKKIILFRFFSLSATIPIHNYCWFWYTFLLLVLPLVWPGSWFGFVSHTMKRVAFILQAAYLTWKWILWILKLW